MIYFLSCAHTAVQCNTRQCFKDKQLLHRNLLHTSLHGLSLPLQQRLGFTDEKTVGTNPCIVFTSFH
jgi:hypothetical protein